MTEDQGIHGRVKFGPLARRVLTVADIPTWLTRTFDPTPVSLPLIEEKLAHEIDIKDDIFDSLRTGYPAFDAWWQIKCVAAHRRVWVLTIDGRLAGIVVRKDEARDEADTHFPGSRILKIATFKVHPDFRGERLGELLLKQILWFAQRNNYDLVYLTAFPDQTTLIRVLEFFGFQHTKTKDDGERFFEKPIFRTRLEPGGALDKFTLDRMNYPRFIADPPANIFCVPIQGGYHRKLFPETARARPLPLFPTDTPLIASRGDRTPGNTIRKVYLCRSNTNKSKPETCCSSTIRRTLICRLRRALPRSGW